MNASLYTHVMRYCPTPCVPPKCPGHRLVKPPVAPPPFEMDEPKPRREVGAMGFERRANAYRRQVPGRTLTDRQQRQLHRMLVRDAFAGGPS